MKYLTFFLLYLITDLNLYEMLDVLIKLDLSFRDRIPSVVCEKT